MRYALVGPTMNQLLPVVFLFLVGAVVAVITLWQKLSKLEGQRRIEAKTHDDRQEELQSLRRELKARRDESEETKRLLQETRNKLKKQQKEPVTAKKRERASTDVAEAAPALSAVATIRVSDQELEARHREALDRIQAELDAARAEVARLREAEQRRQREAQQAAKALEAASAARAEGEPATTDGAPLTWAAAVSAPPAAARSSTPSSPPPLPPRDAPSDGARADETASLRSQLEAMKGAAVEREKELKRELRRAEEAASSAAKRASNNHQLYQVIKGQLELAEDRLATLRQKYEGARAPEALKRDTPPARSPRGERGGRRGDGRRRAESGTNGQHPPAEANEPTAAEHGGDSAATERPRPSEDSAGDSNFSVPPAVEVAEDQIVEAVTARPTELPRASDPPVLTDTPAPAEAPARASEAAAGERDPISPAPEPSLEEKAGA